MGRGDVAQTYDHYLLTTVKADLKLEEASLLRKGNYQGFFECMNSKRGPILDANSNSKKKYFATQSEYQQNVRKFNPDSSNHSTLGSKH